MDIDNLFKQTRRLKAPDSLKIKVEQEISKSAVDVREIRWFDGLSRFLLINKKALAIAVAAAAIIIIAIRMIPSGNEGVTHPTEFVEFLDETLGQVFIGDQEPWSMFEGSEQYGDFGHFFKNQVEEIFWIKGGNNHA
jgi:hypothetical protein